MYAPRSPHYVVVLRILRYLKGTIFDGLHFSSYSSLTFQAYSDADWVGDPTDHRSTTRYCFLLGDSCKTRENSNFLKNGKIVILVKIRNFSRSQMKKRISPLESSREI